MKIEIFITIDDQISENEITHEFYQTQKGAGICKSYSKPSVERLKVKRRTNELQCLIASSSPCINAQVSECVKKPEPI